MVTTILRKLELNRNNYYTQTSIGKLNVEGKYFGHTLEDTVRAFGIKVYGDTAISHNMEKGYKLGIHYSARFKREVLIIYTENDKETLKYGGISFKFTYFHGLNKHEETLGCIGIAKTHNKNTIYGSLEKELFELVAPWIKNGDDVRLFIKNNNQAA